mmetsp:Transcript_19382/g.35106  ORF Transcript_19382/g.35106 Transcript_19382/m.35106 type:complete len:489 (+) Transcript_19382:243-1709(+)
MPSLNLPLILSVVLTVPWKNAQSFSISSYATSPKIRTTTTTSNHDSTTSAISGPTSTTSTALHATTYKPIFDFTLDPQNPTTKSKSASSFERIDDAIMGGISTSSLRDNPTESYATWSGVCRTDGGGFCGMRTLPFASPLDADGQEGVFLDCMLASDEEASRRVWKMTVRTDSSRGEMVYQAEYDLQRVMEEECDLREALEEARAAEAELQEAMEGVAKMNVAEDVGKEMEEAKGAGEDLMKAMNDAKKEDGEGDGNGNGGEEEECWARVFVPFDKFQLVRGPRLVPDGPKLNVTGGIFQIGMTLSKFQMGVNTTELENFRPGYFEMRIQRMGFYNTNGDAAPAVANDANSNDGYDNASVIDNVPDTLSKKEAQKKRPFLLKMLLPLAKVFFSEKANRRKSAMRILREERGLSRGKAILFGIRSRKRSMGGCIPSVFKTLGILTVDSFRAVALSVLKVVLLYPLRVVGAVVRKVKQMLGLTVKPSLRE